MDADLEIFIEKKRREGLSAAVQGGGLLKTIEELDIEYIVSKFASFIAISNLREYTFDYIKHYMIRCV